jgi:hypothetical protein
MDSTPPLTQPTVTRRRQSATAIYANEEAGLILESMSAGSSTGPVSVDVHVGRRLSFNSDTGANMRSAATDSQPEMVYESEEEGMVAAFPPARSARVGAASSSVAVSPTLASPVLTSAGRRPPGAIFFSPDTTSLNFPDQPPTLRRSDMTTVARSSGRSSDASNGITGTQSSEGKILHSRVQVHKTDFKAIGLRLRYTHHDQSSDDEVGPNDEDLISHHKRKEALDAESAESSRKRRYDQWISLKEERENIPLGAATLSRAPQKNITVPLQDFVNKVMIHTGDLNAELTNANDSLLLHRQMKNTSDAVALVRATKLQKKLSDKHALVEAFAAHSKAAHKIIVSFDAALAQQSAEMAKLQIEADQRLDVCNMMAHATSMPCCALCCATIFDKIVKMTGCMTLICLECHYKTGNAARGCPWKKCFEEDQDGVINLDEYGSRITRLCTLNYTYSPNYWVDDIDFARENVAKTVTRNVAVMDTAIAPQPDVLHRYNIDRHQIRSAPHVESD